MTRGDERQGDPGSGIAEATREEALEGSVERVTFYNPENGFSVVRLRVRGRREPIAVVGTLPAAQPGELLSLRGHWQTDPRHGAQFRPIGSSPGIGHGCIS